MWIRIIFFILISPYIFIYGREGGNQLRLLSNGSSKLRMKQLRSPIEIYSINSTYRYVRVLVWSKDLMSKRLKSYFTNFELLDFNGKWIEQDKVDVIKQTNSIYERFTFVYSSEKQAIITVFLKLNLQNNSKNFSIESTIEEVKQVSKIYGFIIFNESPTPSIILHGLVDLILFVCIVLLGICTINSLYKLGQKCGETNVNDSVHIHTENLLNQNAGKQGSLPNEENSVKIDLQNLLNENVEGKSRLQDVQNWVDHLNEYENSPESEKKSFVEIDDEVNSFSNHSERSQ